MVGCVSGCVGTAGCHTLLHLYKSVLSVGDPSLQEASVQISEICGRKLQQEGWLRGYGRDAIPSYICVNPCYLWETLLYKMVLCRSVKSVGGNHSKKVLCRSVKSVGENHSKKVLRRSVKSVGGNHSKKVLCRSVKSVGENHSEKVLCRSVKFVGENHSEKVL